MNNSNELVARLTRYREAYEQTPGADGTVEVLTDAMTEIQSLQTKLESDHNALLAKSARLDRAEWALSDIDNHIPTSERDSYWYNRIVSILDNHYGRNS